MRKSIYLLLILAFAALPACSEADKLEVERLQAELRQLEGVGKAVPEAIEPKTDAIEPFNVVFGKDFYGVDAGGSVSVSYTLSETSEVRLAVSGGLSAELKEVDGKSGQIVVRASDPATPGSILMTVESQSGKRTAVPVNVKVRDPYTDATRPHLNALGYYSFKPAQANIENYRKLADAGITAVTVEGEDYDWEYQMDLARQVGMKVLLIIGFLGGRYADDPEHYTGLDERVNKVKDRPELLAYHIYDEPSVNAFNRLKLPKERIEALDPVHPVYINLNPEGSSASLGVSTYYEYVDILSTNLKTKLISFDMYPVLPGGLMTNWHKCLGIVSEIAAKNGIPLWAFAASCWIDQETLKRAKPTVENLRLQVYNDLAYGAEYVQYFTITSYGGTSFAPIMSYSGEWTQAYDILKEANLQASRRAFIFSGGTVKKVRLSNIPFTWDDNLSISDLPPSVKSLYVSREAVISFVENRGNEYMVIVNNDWQNKQSVSFELAEMAYEIDRSGEFCELQPGIVNLEIDEGDMLAIKLK